MRFVSILLLLFFVEIVYRVFLLQIRNKYFTFITVNQTRKRNEYMLSIHLFKYMAWKSNNAGYLFIRSCSLMRISNHKFTCQEMSEIIQITTRTSIDQIRPPTEKEIRQSKWWKST